MKDALDIHRALLERETPHEIVRLRSLIFSADELPHVLALPRKRCLAVRSYETGDRLVAFLVQAGQIPPLVAVNAAAGVHGAQPAPCDLVNRVTDYAAGLVAPLLLPSSVRLFADRHTVDAVASDDVVYTATGDSGTTLGIRLHDLMDISRPRVCDLATRDIQLPDMPGAVLPAFGSPTTFAGGSRR